MDSERAEQSGGVGADGRVTHVRHEYTKHSGQHWRTTFVAVVLPGYDWAAYVTSSFDASAYPPEQGLATHGRLTEEQAVEQCRLHGNKLSKAVAEAMFGGIEEAYSGR